MLPMAHPGLCPMARIALPIWQSSSSQGMGYIVPSRIPMSHGTSTCHGTSLVYIALAMRLSLELPLGNLTSHCTAGRPGGLVVTLACY